MYSLLLTSDTKVCSHGLTSPWLSLVLAHIQEMQYAHHLSRQPSGYPGGNSCSHSFSGACTDLAGIQAFPDCPGKYDLLGIFETFI